MKRRFLSRLWPKFFQGASADVSWSVTITWSVTIANSLTLCGALGGFSGWLLLFSRFSVALHAGFCRVARVTFSFLRDSLTTFAL